MPGVSPLLDALARRDDVFLALLTGNYEEGARLKLEHFDLWRYFPCGAFGDTTHDRNGLLPEALARVAVCGGPRADPADAVIIGDTPLDVAVAARGRRAIDRGRHRQSHHGRTARVRRRRRVSGSQRSRGGAGGVGAEIRELIAVSPRPGRSL